MAELADEGRSCLANVRIVVLAAKRRSARGGSIVPQLLFIDCRQPPVIEHHAAADHDAIDRGTVLGEDNLADDIVARHVIDVAEIEKDDIGFVAWRDFADRPPKPMA